MANSLHDNPIEKIEDDTLGRSSIVKSFVEQVLNLDAKHGATVGIFGPWGSGKTSFINFVTEELKEKGFPVLEFNPWMFSGTEQLVERFFDGIAAELKLSNITFKKDIFRLTLSKLAIDFAKYGKALNGHIGGISYMTEAHLRTHLKGNIEKALTRIKDINGEKNGKQKDGGNGMEAKVIIIIDDVDRLTDSEVRDIFKLVRLTASFPKLVYIIACDRIQVERALSKSGISGREYLAKIVQLPFDLPSITDETFEQQVDTAIKSVVSKKEYKEFLGNRSPWKEIRSTIILPLLTNIRDVRRYTITVQEAMSNLKEEIALPDLLGIEAIRIFLPDVFQCIRQEAQVLTTRPSSNQKQNEQRASSINKLIRTGGETHKEVVRSMIRELFPFGWQYIGEVGDEKSLGPKRIGNESIIRRYMER